MEMETGCGEEPSTKKELCSATLTNKQLGNEGKETDDTFKLFGIEEKSEPPVVMFGVSSSSNNINSVKSTIFEFSGSKRRDPNSQLMPSKFERDSEICNIFENSSSNLMELNETIDTGTDSFEEMDDCSLPVKCKFISSNELSRNVSLKVTGKSVNENIKDKQTNLPECEGLVNNKAMVDSSTSSYGSSEGNNIDVQEVQDRITSVTNFNNPTEDFCLGGRKRAVCINDSEKITKQRNRKQISIVQPMCDKKKIKASKVVEIISKTMSGDDTTSASVMQSNDHSDTDWDLDSDIDDITGGKVNSATHSDQEQKSSNGKERINENSALESSKIELSELGTVTDVKESTSKNQCSTSKDLSENDPMEVTSDESTLDSENIGPDDLETLLQSAIDKNEKFCKETTSSFSDNIYDKDSNNVTTPTDKPTLDVIYLIDDDDDDFKIKLKKPIGAIRCINPSCISGEELYKPSMFVLSYFGLKRTKDQLVCEECYNAVAEHYKNLASMLKEEKPLFSAEFPCLKDIILIDSDEESISDDDSYLSDGTLEIIQKNVDEVIAESLVKYGLDHQIRESCHILNNKIESLEEDFKAIDERFNQVQHTLDECRKQIYKDFTPNTQEVEEVQLLDCEIPPMPILRHKHQTKMYFKGLREARGERDKQSKDLPTTGTSRSVACKKVTPIQSDLIQDVIAVHSETRCVPPSNLPMDGPLKRPKLRVGDMVYTMKLSYFSIWVLSRIIEIIPKNPTENDQSTEAYRVRYENCKKPIVKTVAGRYLAYDKPASTLLCVGTRVIAIFKEEEELASDRKNYYVGVIAEPAKSTNKYRYLVFFDDGYTQYCPHENILVVCHSNRNVWEDIHPEPRDFIKNYLQQYPERAMVKLNKGQVVKVEWNGRWWIVRVLEVDASLVKVHFDADKRTEWIYRGSTRLGPMFQELAAAKERQSGSLPRGRGFGGASNHKSDLPYVEYTRGDGDEKRTDEPDEDQLQLTVPTRSVARKSTSKKPISNPAYTQPLVSEVPIGNITERKIVPLYKPLRYRQHICSVSCVDWTNYTPSTGKHYDLLIKPLMFAFQRLKLGYRGKYVIMYRTPCGRTVRSHEEMLNYLQTTRSSLTVDLFDFDFWVNPLNNFEEGKTFGRIEDLSYGKENVAISCVNELDHSMPQYVQYMTARQPAPDVFLNLDPEFLVGCDCTDDCQDREKCSCWQLTMQGKAYVPDGDLDPLFGYQFRRLPERIATGIYECNSRCKCCATCQNRVAQQPLSFRLQLFKTLNKGWGIRCHHDIPRGSFICIYAGFLLTDAAANEGGKTYGDEYLAELDYIESVENLKDGYESDAAEMSDSEDDNFDVNVEDYDQKIQDYSRASRQQNDDIRLRLRRRILEESDKDSTKKHKQDDDSSTSLSDEEENTARLPQTFNATITENDVHESKYPSVRDLYGQNEEVYIMDAKTHGNIGRYLNHSCSPNVFVQNVFVDTHDLRFPWVAFFANQYIRAGTELTWDYNYDVGSVPGKTMLCYCGSPTCRGRLL